MKPFFTINRNEIVGKTDLDIFPGESRSPRQGTYRKMIARYSKLDIPLELETKTSSGHDDRQNTYISLKFPLFDSSGIPLIGYVEYQQTSPSVSGLKNFSTDKFDSEAPVMERLIENLQRTAWTCYSMLTTVEGDIHAIAKFPS